MRLDLRAANAIQTYSTVRELRALLPGMRLAVPRWLNEPSAFSGLGAIHLPRPAINKLSKFVPWGGWSYIERTLFSFMLVILLVMWRLVGRGYRVLYVRDTVCAAWLSLFAALHGSCVVYEVHDLETLHPTKAARWPAAFWSRFLPWLDRMALGRPRKLVSLTGTFKEWALEHGRDAGDVAVIPDAFDPALYPLADKTEARQELGLPPSSFTVGYAGLTFAYRRLDLLVEAFAMIARPGDNELLVLVGGRPHEVAELREQVARLGVGEKVVTTGAVDHEQAARYLQASDLLVIPDTVTQMTASPLKLFEYMAAGRPIILKDMPALREILDDSSARFFRAGDADDLASALRELRDDPAEAGRLAGNALSRSEEYTYRARAEKILEVVKSCR